MRIRFFAASGWGWGRGAGRVSEGRFFCGDGEDIEGKGKSGGAQLTNLNARATQPNQQHAARADALLRLDAAQGVQLSTCARGGGCGKVFVAGGV